MNRKTEELEEIIGYHFKNIHYLTQALTHSSYANEKKLGKLGSNERLEFLGDAVLELISSDYLYARFTQIPEGELTKKRASLVCEPSLAYCAREFGLPQFLLLGKGEDMTGGRNSNIDLEPEGIITAYGYIKSAEDYEKALTALKERLNEERYD